MLSCQHVAMRVEARVVRTWGLVAGQAVIIGDRFKHVEPDIALLALEVSGLELDSVQRAHRVTRCRQIRAEAQSQIMATCSASLFHIFVLVLFYLAQERLQAVLRLPLLDIGEPLSVLLRYLHFHLGQSALLFHISRKDLFLSVHVIIAVEVDCLCSGCCVAQILFHSFEVQLLQLFLCELLSLLELLVGSHDLRAAVRIGRVVGSSLPDWAC